MKPSTISTSRDRFDCAKPLPALQLVSGPRCLVIVPFNPLVELILIEVRTLNIVDLANPPNVATVSWL